MKRPAESAGVAGGIAALVARIAGVTDPDTITYIAIAIGVIPAAVTFVVTHGGLAGVWRLVIRGKSQKGYASTELILAVLIVALAVWLGVWVHPLFFLVLLLLILLVV